LYESPCTEAFPATSEEVSARDLNISRRDLEALLYRVDKNMEKVSALHELNTSRPTTYANLIASIGSAPGNICSG